MSDEPVKNTGNAGKGRKPGVPNKTTGLLKDMILTALEGAHPKGSVGYLKQQAIEQPVAFLTLVGKVLPTQVHGPGEQGEHIVEIAWRVVQPSD